jgi:3-oxoacyl-[acyl-carrier protein] reductase
MTPHPPAARMPHRRTQVEGGVERGSVSPPLDSLRRRIRSGGDHPAADLRPGRARCVVYDARMDLGIRGRTAMVAAASKGLGRAIARVLVREGARVSIAARHAASLAEAERDLLASVAGAEVLAVPVDVTRADDLVRWHALTRERFGDPALLLTNTGGPPAGRFQELDEAAWRAGVDATIMNVVRLCHVVLPAMRERRYGRIVHLTSFVAKQPLGLLTISSTLRAGLSALTKAMATEFAPEGVTVNAILPGHFLTDRQIEINELRARAAGVTREAWEQTLLAGIPARRFGRPEELAEVAAFLLSEPAAYLTGTSIQVDGGLVGGTF